MFFQRGNADGQQPWENMLNISNHRGNTNQTTTRDHFTLVIMAITEKNRN